MKKLSIIFMLIAGIFLVSCDKEEVGPVIGDTVSPELTAPASGLALELTEANAGDLITFEWTAADYGFSAAITYILEMDFAGNEFANPILLGNFPNALTTTLTNGELNTKLIANGVSAGATANLEFRISSKVSAAYPNLTSALLPVSAKTYMVVIEYPMLNIPGSYQGWNPEDETTVIYSLKSDDVYEGYIYFTETPTTFKFAKGSWDFNWGDTGADGTLDAAGDDISAAEAGYYKLNADLVNLTYSMMKTDWGLIGSATPGGWDSDQNMTYDMDTKEWSITVDLVAGEMKFRANDAWDLDYGETDPATGFLVAGGANIAITDAGNYTIALVLSQANYTYRVVKN